ncbi:MAG: hypothetical protein NTW25_09190 [Candidatus Kapabacteria bacterium]|nr:hypothetical protein [Candidatus Kapabacteria bacterium]
MKNKKLKIVFITLLVFIILLGIGIFFIYITEPFSNHPPKPWKHESIKSKIKVPFEFIKENNFFVGNKINETNLFYKLRYQDKIYFYYSDNYYRIFNDTLFTNPHDENQNDYRYKKESTMTINTDDESYIINLDFENESIGINRNTLTKLQFMFQVLVREYGYKYNVYQIENDKLSIHTFYIIWTLKENEVIFRIESDNKLSTLYNIDSNEEIITQVKYNINFHSSIKDDKNYFKIKKLNLLEFGLIDTIGNAPKQFKK